MINTLNAATIGGAPATEAPPSDTERAEVERLVAAVKAGNRDA